MSRLIAILLAVATVAACGPADEQQVAERAVATFHEAARRESFKEIYAAADPEFRGAIDEESFLRLMRNVADKLGAHVRAELKAQHLDHRPSATLVMLGYQSEFQRGLAIERFVFKVAEGRATLGSYNIHSPAFNAN